MSTCSVEDCSSDVKARGFCGAHYGRWYRYGDPLGVGSRPYTRFEPGSDEKACPKCSEVKPLEAFYYANHTPSRRAVYCTECMRKENKTPKAREWDRWNKLLRTFGLTREQYEAMLAEQGGGCAVCGATEPGNKATRFDVDHDHACCPGKYTCGKCIRGLLCHGCNASIGNAGESARRLYLLATYVARGGHGAFQSNRIKAAA